MPRRSCSEALGEEVANEAVSEDLAISFSLVELTFTEASGTLARSGQRGIFMLRPHARAENERGRGRGHLAPPPTVMILFARGGS